jgi:DivIVA domain-containing protein
VALDRQTIERRDFPIARRGYDIEAVDAHLEAVADAVEALGAGQPRARVESLASSASEQVRAIIEAAEHSAAEIGREADLESRRIRQDAREGAEQVRVEAVRQARDHVQRVAEAARATLERVQALDQELGGLLETVRGGAGRVAGDLGMLEASVAVLQSVADAAPAPPAPAPPKDAPASPAPLQRPVAAQDGPALPDVPPEAAAAAAEALPAAGDPVGGATPAAPSEAPVGAVVQERTRRRRARPAPDAGSGGAVAPAASDETEGARLIALNLALNGAPRDEAERHLRETYDLADPGALLDDVYSRIGK